MRWRHLGPGLLLAATSIGASHLLMSPEAGARFQYELVWLVVVVHLVKYPAFEFAPRWVAATGTSLFEAYEKAPGPKRWAIWLGLVDMTVQAIGLVAALVGLTASFLVVAFGTPFGFVTLEVWSVGLLIVLLLLLAAGHYRALRVVNIGLLLFVALGTAVAFLGAPPPLSALPAMATPSFPVGSLVLVGAILGFMPTSVAVSVWQSLWALEHGRFRNTDGADAEDRQTLLREGLFDLRLGYGLSVVLAVLFISLGAVLLHPRGLVPEGPEVALVLSNLYTLVLGEWMRPIVLVMAFAALFTTCYTMMDGFPRSFVAARRVLRGESAFGGEVDRVYWTFLLTVTFGGMAILSWLPDPALLVKVVGGFGLVLSPIYYILNLWAVTRWVDDPRLRPGKATVALAVVGILTMVATAGLLLWTTIAR